MDIENIKKSYWIASTNQKNYPKLAEDFSVDVLVIGGGISGIMTAFYLKRAKFDVVLIESGKILSSVTGHTTAKATFCHGLIYHYLISKFGVKKAWLYFNSNQSAIDELESLVKDEKISCDFSRQAFNLYSQTDSGLKKLKEEWKALKKLKIPASFEKEYFFNETKGNIKIENQAIFHPRKFLLEISNKFIKEGGKIFENTRAIEVKNEKIAFVKTNSGRVIKAKNVVITTNYPILKKPGKFFMKLYPNASHAISVQIKQKFPNEMFFSVDENGLSFRKHRWGSKEFIIISGESHKIGEENSFEHYQNLINKSQKFLNVKSIDYAWSAHDAMSADKIPIIGETTKFSKNIFIATGFSKWGMTKGILSGMIIRDIVLKRNNPWIELYKPSRSMANVGKKIVRENIFIFNKYFERFQKMKFDFSNIQKDEGKIIEINKKKLGVYKDKKGKILAVNPYCTHLGCLVHWNNAEKSWDCPCHGSRYDIFGNIIREPAVNGLNKEEIKK
ncbi:MAG: FAD-dependent oxidoreductase [Nanoarchaeota archaeon]